MPDVPEDAPAGSAARVAAIAALIRNTLSNSPISQSLEAWHALETRLPALVDAIIKEL